ncbi:hypothetical protein NNO07_22540 [Pseudomonas resinovorans]|uniref:Uncharacterized protein n=1 Tax=Metapseudomonas resinovorans TaxID=53412 RepID=A0ABT4YAF8_METRE|nr:hypothetical protein [Pseudomonas resinovorans]MDA8485855.1 hypothetical protein [Pseudomonas resinovorans]
MGFQTVINQQPAPAVEGDFASANPMATALPSNGVMVAAPGGVIVGRFAWVTGSLVTNAGADVPAGFIHRNQQAVMFDLLTEATMVIPEGFAVTIHNAGDFWARTTTVATVGQKVFASNTTGEIATDDAGATVAGFTETKWSVASPAASGELIKMSNWV